MPEPDAYDPRPPEDQRWSLVADYEPTVRWYDTWELVTTSVQGTVQSVGGSEEYVRNLLSKVSDDETAHLRVTRRREVTTMQTYRVDDRPYFKEPTTAELVRARAALNYIASPTMGLPGESQPPEAYVRENASSGDFERFTYALEICIRMAREARFGQEDR